MNRDKTNPSYGEQIIEKADSAKGNDSSNAGCWFNTDGSIMAGFNPEMNEKAVTLHIYPDGSHEIIHWQNGVMHGEYSIWYPDGSRSIREYANGIEDAPGTKIRKDGSIEVLNIHDGEYRSEIIILSNNKTIITRTFEQGVLTGEVIRHPELFKNDNNDNNCKGEKND